MVPPPYFTSPQAPKITSSIVSRNAVPVTVTVTKNIPLTNVAAVAKLSPGIVSITVTVTATVTKLITPVIITPIVTPLIVTQLANITTSISPPPPPPIISTFVLSDYGIFASFSENAAAVSQLAAQSLSQNSLAISGKVAAISGNPTMLSAEGIQVFTGFFNIVQVPTSGGEYAIADDLLSDDEFAYWVDFIDGVDK